MVDFINEVEEELRKDDYNKLLRRYGPVIAGLIVVVLITAGYLEYREWADGRTGRATSASYVAAGNMAETSGADASAAAFVDLSDVAPEGYAGLSLMRAAQIKLEQDDRAAAVTLYDKAAVKFSRPRHKQLAQLKAAYVLAGNGAWSDVRNRATPLSETGAPYEFLARELLGLAAEAQGDAPAAREQFAYLKSIPGVPERIASRASQSLTLMDTRAGADTEQVLPEPTFIEPDTAQQNSSDDDGPDE